MRDAVIIQQCTSTNSWQMPWSNSFNDMQRLTQPRHQAYARAWNFDLRVTFGDLHAEQRLGAWPKIELILEALRAGYAFVVWVDSDAAIMDFGVDLRSALAEGQFIGAALHTPEKSAFLKQHEVPAHLNVGVLYVRNSELTRTFFEEWLSGAGDARWMEQGSFNELCRDERFKDICTAVADTFNATVNVNPVDNPAVIGWHGVMPPEARLGMMKAALAEDFIKFKV
jgi:hypothetical protein